MVSRARNKLSVRQAASIAAPGFYSDGGGLYLRVRESGRSWLYIGTLDGRRLELGLCSAIDISLATARKRADEIRLTLIDGKDPREERAKAKVKKAPVITFGKFAMDFARHHRGRFQEPQTPRPVALHLHGSCQALVPYPDQ